jgi:cold shock protein
MEHHDSPGGRVMTGLVKWFDPGKGFGFIVADEGGPDILLHANVLRNFGQGSVADASAIEVTVQQTDRGLQAVTIGWIRAPDQPMTSSLSDLADLDPDELARQPLEPARVKWFDKIKGFGFANVFGRDEDVFVHIEVLRKSGLSDLQPGEAVALRVMSGKRGRMATEVLAWDVAVRHSGPA